MSNFLGEFECKLDAKSRLSIPAALRKSLDPSAQEKFVVNRGFESCLSLFPYNEWLNISAEINKLNRYNKKNREFMRYFYRGAMELSLDAAGRLLLPKRLMEYAGIDKEIILSAYSNIIEVWDKSKFDNLLTKEPEDFANLAEEVMGGNKNDEQGIS
ncbi:MAG TPA: division/cell wall cluster transcriptional repressor MraZ [Bacteroidia bacterium]|nr:division/cell wall cluster transcriptional repressor MraZ [Bacteroidia bacterium]